MKPLQPYLRRGIGVTLLAAVLTGCGTPWKGSTGPVVASPQANVPSTPVANASPSIVAELATATSTQVIIHSTQIPAPTTPAATPQVIDARPTNPIIGFTPTSGGPGTAIDVWGAGAAPNTHVVVRLGLPRAMGEALASAKTDTAGRWNTRFVMPDRLPSGDLITADKVNLVAMNEQNQALASASFGFAAAAGPTREAASQAVRNLLNNFGSGNVEPYVAPSVRRAMEAGRPVHQILGLVPMAWESIDVGAPEARPSEVLFVPATLTYPTFIEQRVFELVVEDQQWKIQGSSVRATSGRS